jgi:hypothetical protein
MNRFYKPQKYEGVQNKQDGWTPTGRVDFIDAESIGNFVLQAEDTRIVASIGGVERREIRWRKATLAEARAVVVAYHSQRNLAMTANFIVTTSIRRMSALNDEDQKTQVGKDQVPNKVPALEEPDKPEKQMTGE